MKSGDRAEPTDARLAQLQHGDAPARLGDSRHLRERGASVRDVANPKRDAAPVKRVVFVRKGLRVARLQLHPIGESAASDFVGTDFQHSTRRVAPHDARVGVNTRDHQSEVTRTSRKIENTSLRRELHRCDGLAPPRLVDAHRHHPVQQVVTARDMIEHLPGTGVGRRALVNRFAH